MTEIATVPSCRLLRSDAEFDAAHAELLTLLDVNPEPGTAEHDRFEYLTVLIEAYDRAHATLDEEPPAPQALVDFALEQRGMTRTDLSDLLGGKSRVSEFFNGVRPLSIAQVKALRAALGIPADLLIPHDDLLNRAQMAERRATQAVRQVRALTDALTPSTRKPGSFADKVRQLRTGKLPHTSRLATKPEAGEWKVAAKAAKKSTVKGVARSAHNSAQKPKPRERSARS